MKPGSGVPRVPVKLVPEPVERVWGGTGVRRLFGWEPPSGGRIGEWWILSYRRDHPSLIDDGEFRGIPLLQLVQAHPELLGSDGRASLLLKFVDSADRLSVQVHPDDALAAQMGLDSGKTECWYFLESRPGAVIYCGLKQGIDPETFFETVAKEPAPGAVEALLEAVPVRKGRTAFIRAGTVHAIGAGVVLLEVQQNSDTTFRIYDWGRPREVHLEQARRAVMNTGGGANRGDAPPGTIAASHLFLLREVRVPGGGPLLPPERTWSAVTCLEGRGRLSCETHTSMFVAGDTYFLPAGCPPIAFEGDDRACWVFSQPSPPEGAASAP